MQGASRPLFQLVACICGVNGLVNHLGGLEYPQWGPKGHVPVSPTKAASALVDQSSLSVNMPEAL